MLIEDDRKHRAGQPLLGHHSPSFTLSTYAHLMDDGVGGPIELTLPAREIPAGGEARLS